MKYHLFDAEITTETDRETLKERFAIRTHTDRTIKPGAAATRIAAMIAADNYLECPFKVGTVEYVKTVSF